MSLMDKAVWHGKIYSGGWVDGSGGRRRGDRARDRRRARPDRDREPR